MHALAKLLLKIKYICTFRILEEFLFLSLRIKLLL
jgi:hypothetical protein